MPVERNTEIEFADETIGSNIPKNLIPALKKGFNEIVQTGPVVGAPVVGIKFRLMDGATHEVDSTEIAMINTARGAMYDIYEDGQWRLIEPIMKVEVTGPIEFQSTVTTTLIGRAAYVMGTSATADQYFIIEAEVPLNNMFGYAMQLRGVTEGKGEYTMEYSRYAPVDASVSQRIIEEVKLHKEQEEKRTQQATATKKSGKKK